MASTTRDSTVIGYPADQVTAGYPYPPLHCHSNNNQPTTPTLNNNVNPEEIKCPRSVSLVVAVIFSLIIAALIIWCSFDMATYPGKNPNFKVQSATVTGLNVTGSELTATWDITLVATNPYHKYRLSFDTLKAWVVCGDHGRIKLGEKILRPFDVNKRNETRINMKLATVSQWVGDDVGKELYDGSSQGLVSFGVHVSGHFRHHPIYRPFSSHYVNFRVDCDHVHFGLSYNGTGKLMEQKECKVKRPEERDHGGGT